MGRKAREKRERRLPGTSAAGINTAIVDLQEGRVHAVSRFLQIRKMYQTWLHKLPQEDEHYRMIERVVDLLNEARIILLPEGFLKLLWGETLQYFNEGILEAAREVTGDAYPDWNRLVETRFIYGKGIPTEVWHEVLQRTIRPFPDRLPFPSTYIALDKPGPPILDENTQTALYGLYKNDLTEANAKLPAQFFGAVLGAEECYCFLHARFAKDPKLATTVPICEYDATRWKTSSGKLQKGFWYHPLSGFARALPLIIDWVFDHKSILDTPYQAPQARQKSISISIPKKLPEPYYVVYMDDVVKVKNWLDTRSKHPKTGKVHLSPQHRFDVREHDRIRVLRGPLPLDPKIRRRLEAVRPVSGRSYHIYTERQPDGLIAEVLFKRGIKRKEPDEWMAVLVTPIHHHIKGPTEGPYVPSVRKARQHATDDDHSDVSKGSEHG